ncbi:MAG: isoprenyl transferase [Hyphomonadaceae bacterium]|jgi:undecaprenyl diphosphate synthase|nr:isoprenyl transferase [Hyphomonadaceae bacterium]
MNEHTAVWTQTQAPTPRHVAIIMDGNGRWAQSRGLPRSAGHRMGVEAVRRTVRAAMEIGVQYLTIFSFSSENWARPASEVDDLMGLMKRFIRRDLAELHENNVRVRVIGERTGVDADLLGMIDEAVRLTSANTALDLVIAFNYGSRAEIARAARCLAERAMQGAIRTEEITPEALSAALDTQGVPDPDLLIRTSGELRLSNFLLWQSAYTEFVFLEACWPDFGRELLQQAIDEFRRRDRRFGGIVARSTG